jgi:hypothetical protein
MMTIACRTAPIKVKDHTWVSLGIIASLTLRVKFGLLLIKFSASVSWAVDSSSMFNFSASGLSGWLTAVHLQGAFRWATFLCDIKA